MINSAAMNIGVQVDSLPAEPQGKPLNCSARGRGGSNQINFQSNKIKQK